MLIFQEGHKFAEASESLLRFVSPRGDDCMVVDSGPPDTECWLVRGGVWFSECTRLHGYALCHAATHACHLPISVERLYIKVNEARTAKGLPGVIWSACLETLQVNLNALHSSDPNAGFLTSETFWKDFFWKPFEVCALQILPKWDLCSAQSGAI